MSNFSFEISHFTGKTTRILSALQGLFLSSDWLNLKFRRKISKSYIINMSGTFLRNNYFLSNFYFVICHLTGKCLRSFAIFFRLLFFPPTREDWESLQKGSPWHPRSPVLRNDPGTVTIPQYRFNKTNWRIRTLGASATWPGAATFSRPQLASVSVDDLDMVVGAYSLLIFLCFDKDSSS